MCITLVMTKRPIPKVYPILIFRRFLNCIGLPFNKCNDFVNSTCCYSTVPKPWHFALKVKVTMFIFVIVHKNVTSYLFILHQLNWKSKLYSIKEIMNINLGISILLPTHMYPNPNPNPNPDP